MPLKKLETKGEGVWGLWTIGESEKDLMRSIEGIERIPDAITNEHKRLEWAAGRTMTKLLMDRLGVPFQGVVKNEFGKPFPKGCGYQLSLSHSYPHVAAYLHPSGSVGIDLEQPTSKLLRIAARIHDVKELEDAGSDLTKHCLYWCAKEVLVKVYGRKDLIFSENLKIEPFSMNKTGKILGRIVVPGTSTTVSMYYEIHSDFTIVLNNP